METSLTKNDSSGSFFFLSYLWGMETGFSDIDLPVMNFLSYLWGMETKIIIIALIVIFTFYPTYEEWKRAYSKDMIW